MNSEIKLAIGIIAATFLIVLGATLFSGGGSQPPATPDQPVAAEVLVRSDSHTLGPQDAKVTVVEFSDFECPACKEAEPTVEQILAKYKDKIRFVYRHFPLPQHTDAFAAAEAAEAAALQGKFWEMHNLLFEKSPALSMDDLKTYAKDLGLNTEKFNKDLDSDAVRQRVLADQADGNKAGISATPTFFINGTRFTGGLTLNEFSKEIDSRL